MNNLVGVQANQNAGMAQSAPGMTGNMPGGQMTAPPAPQPPPSQDDVMDALEKVHYLNDGLRTLLNKEGGPSRSDVIDEAGHLIAEGILSPQQAAQELQSLPTDNAQIKTWLQQHIFNSHVTAAKLMDLLAHMGRNSMGQMQAAPPSMSQPMQNALTAGMAQGG